MIPTKIQADPTAQTARTNPVSPITPVTAQANANQSHPQFTQGQKYQALVEARLQNGNARVIVAGQTLQMQLPEHFQPGNKLELIFIGREPQLKFLLQNDPAIRPGSNIAKISPAGHLLGSLLHDAIQSRQPAPLPNTAPIMSNPLINSSQLPSLLQKAITQSGLFYESHLAQWIAGKNTLKQLQQEPQSKLSIAAMTTTNSTDSDAAGVHAQSLPFVQQQLSVLETGHLVWRGEVWPGQYLEWDIAEYEDQQQNLETGKTPNQWQMQLHLTMPQLGKIHAKIAFHTDKINIRLEASATQTADLMYQNQLPLTTAINQAGLHIQTVEIKSDDI